MLTKRVNAYFAVFLALVVVIAGVGLGGALLKSKKERDARNGSREATVMTVGSVKVSRSELELFCVAVTESEAYEEIRAATATKQARAQAVKKKAAEMIAQYAALRGEAEFAGVGLSAKDIESISQEAQRGLSREEANRFYRTNYGISFDRYVDYVKGWAICEKYLERFSSADSYDEEVLRQVFAKNMTKLAWAWAEVIYIRIPAGDGGAASLKRSLAENAVQECNALPEEERGAFLRVFYEDYNEAGFANGTFPMVLNGEVTADYPALFDAVCLGTPGTCYLMETESALFVVRITEQHLFDSFRNSEELKSLALEDNCRRVIEEAVNQPKYEVTYTAEFDKTDITKYINE